MTHFFSSLSIIQNIYISIYLLMTLLSVISLKTSEDIIIKPLFACKTSKKQKYASSSGYVKSNNVPQIFFLLSRLKFFSLQRVKGGGDDRSGVAEWLGRWTCNLVVLGSSPPPSYSPDLFSVSPCSAPRMRCLNSLMVCLLPVGIF